MFDASALDLMIGALRVVIKKTPPDGHSGRLYYST